MNISLGKWWRWIPAVLFMLLIFLVSNQKGGESGQLSKMVLDFLESIGLDFRYWFGENAFVVIRKLAHFTEYFILFQLFSIALFSKNPWPRYAWVALLASALYAGTDEIHQLFIPGRKGLLSDVFIDSLGASFGLFSHFIIFSFKKARKRNRPGL